MGMLLGHWNDEDDNDNGHDEFIERTKQELIDGSPSFGMHWRDFDAEVEGAWRNRNSKND